MKILLLSYGEIDFDGRLRELYQVCQQLGETYLISRGSRNLTDTHFLLPEGQTGYLKFISFCRRLAETEGPFDLIFADNRKAILPAYLIRRKQKQAKLVFDARELYLMHEVRGFSSKLGCLVEKIFNKKADLLISANADRAEIMKDYYGLTQPVLVYENLRQLTYPETYRGPQVAEEILEALKTDRLKLISTSGCSVSRTNDRLVEAAAKFPDEVLLLLVGSSSEQDRLAIERLIDDRRAKNVLIVDQVDEGTLKFLIELCDVGIVNYSSVDTNNTYCASGKLYEFIFEGKPVITTENPPLKRLIDRCGFGLADNGYEQAIRLMIDDYGQYLEAARKGRQDLDIAENNRRLAQSIKQFLLQGDD